MALVFNGFAINNPPVSHEPRHERQFILVGGGGHKAQVEIAGALIAKLGSRARIAINGIVLPVIEAKNDAPNFRVSGELPLPLGAQRTPVRITIDGIDLADPGEAAQLQIDSVDIALHGGKICY